MLIQLLIYGGPFVTRFSSVKILFILETEVTWFWSSVRLFVGSCCSKTACKKLFNLELLLRGRIKRYKNNFLICSFSFTFTNVQNHLTNFCLNYQYSHDASHWGRWCFNNPNGWKLWGQTSTGQRCANARCNTGLFV